MDKVLKDLMLEIDLQAVLEAMESADGEEEILGKVDVRAFLCRHARTQSACVATDTNKLVCN